MKNHTTGFIFSVIAVLFPMSCLGQHIFSEKSLEYKKTFLPYDVSYTFALEDKEFVMLSESRKNVMKLGRYDQYFFEKWEKELEFNPKESVPQIYLHGDSVITYCFTVNSDKNQILLSFRYFDLETGEEKTGTNYSFSMISDKDFFPRLSFSEDNSRFVVYNYPVTHENKPKITFQLFEVGNTSPIKQYFMDPEIISLPKTSSVHLDNAGNILLVSVDATNFKLEGHYWGIKTNGSRMITSNFFFERPVENIGEIGIIQQSESSYFVTFTALIDEELIGFNVTGFNVILKSVMFAYNQDLRKDEIQTVYENYYVANPNQRKKLLEIPEVLENYRLTTHFVNSENDILLCFEELEIPSFFQQNHVSENRDWKYKSDEDKFYFGGDLLLYNFTERGELKWRKTIQKAQYSQANALGLSILPKMKNDTLSFLIFDSSKGGNFHILDLDALDGSMIESMNLLPDQKFEFAKKYSCWLSDNSVILCGIAPGNIYKRTLMLVEF